MKFVTQPRWMAERQASMPAKTISQIATIDGPTERPLDIRCYLPALPRQPGGSTMPTVRDLPTDAARAGASGAAGTDLTTLRPILVVLGSLAGWSCGPSSYDPATLTLAFAACDSVMVVASACSELLFQGIATCASVKSKTVLIETVPASAAAWLSAVRRYAPRTAEVTVEPNDVAFGDSLAELARA